MDALTGAAVGGVTGLLMVAVNGLVIGAVAKPLMPGPDPGGWFVTILLGIAGSWVGNVLFGPVRPDDHQEEFRELIAVGGRRMRDVCGLLRSTGRKWQFSPTGHGWQYIFRGNGCR